MQNLGYGNSFRRATGLHTGFQSHSLRMLSRWVREVLVIISKEAIVEVAGSILWSTVACLSSSRRQTVGDRCCLSLVSTGCRSDNFQHNDTEIGTSGHPLALVYTGWMASVISRFSPIRSVTFGSCCRIWPSSAELSQLIFFLGMELVSVSDSQAS